MARVGRALVCGVLCLGLSLLAAGPGRAGAWGRPYGKGFVSTGSVVAPYEMPWGRTIPVRREDRIYVELGLRHGWMAQADLSFAPGGAGETFVTLGRALPWTPLGGVMRGSVGLGWRRMAGVPTTMVLRPGVVWGRGFRVGKLSGWFQADAQAEVLRGYAVPKLDLQAGVNFWKRSMLIFEIQANRYPAAHGQVRLTPSLVLGLGRRTHLQLRPEWTIGPRHDPALSIALWTDF